MTDTSKIDERAEALVLSLVDAGVFEIDGDGRIWRVGIMKRGKLAACARRRAEYPSTNGYLRIRVSVNGVRIRVSAHRVVYRYHVGEIPPGKVIDHENRKRYDNRPGNLEPVTQRQNVRRALRLIKREQAARDRESGVAEAPAPSVSLDESG